MKHPLILLLCSLTLILRMTGHAAEQAAFVADISHGNIRCVLLSVNQTTVFPNEVDTAQKGRGWQESPNGVPCFTVTFLIEALGDGPSEPHTLKKLDVLSAGKPIRMKGGIYQQWFDYKVFPDFSGFTKPKVTNHKRARIMRYVQYSSIPDLQPFKLVIETGFDKDIEKFEFDSIRILGHYGATLKQAGADQPAAAPKSKSEGKE